MKKIDLKTLIDEELARRGKTFKWLVNELEMSFDGLKGGLENESIKLRDLKKLVSVLNLPIQMFFDGSNHQTISGSYNVQSSNSVVAEPVAAYKLESLNEQIEQLKSQLRDKNEIIQLLRVKRT